MKYSQQYYEYPSGLRLLFVKSPNFYTAKINIMFLVGSEDEKSPRGLAHLLEHSVFKGTDKYNQEQISELFNGMSADIDASTSSETTVFSASFPLGRIEDVSKLYSHILTQSVYDDEEIEKEKKVIIEEILMHEDIPDQACFDQLVRSMFSDCGIGNDIAGEIELLKKVKTDDIKEFHRSYYHTKNMLVSVVGDYEFSEVKKIVDQYFNKPFVRSGKVKMKEWSSPSRVKNVIKQTKKDTLQANVMMGFRCPSYTNFERFDFGLIAFILGGSMNSRLFSKIRNELALCYMISSFEISYKNNAFMAINFSTSIKNTQKCIEAVRQVLYRVIEEGVTDAEFESAKQLNIDRYLMSLDHPKANLKYLACTGKILNPEEITNYLSKCTKKKALDIFKKYVESKNAFISIVSGEKLSKLDNN